jgi:hypothetical protein
MFLDLGKGDNIAMFYYFGAETQDDIPKYGNHHSFAANSLEELHQWGEWLEANGHEVKMRNTYEVFSSIYVWDPNGRWFEIAANHRPLGAVDAEDGQLTARALIVAAAEKAKKITRMWEIKAQLVEEQEGAIASPALIFPKLDEFMWIPAAAGDSVNTTYDRGNFTVLEADQTLQLTRPNDLPESLWWSLGTGGVKGKITHFNDHQITITTT